MICLKCGGESMTLETRWSDLCGYTRRTRKCLSCLKTFSTIETYVAGKPAKRLLVDRPPTLASMPIKNPDYINEMKELDKKQQEEYQNE